MRKLILLLSTFIISFSLYAQTRTLEVGYTYMHPVQTMRSTEPDVTNRYILHTDGHKSKFYSPNTEYIDSIESTPEGFEMFNTLKRELWQKREQDKIPRADGSFYVTKFLSDNELHTYDIANGTKFHVKESLPEPLWTIEDSCRTILGYECTKASADFYGRKWTVWFTPDIPVNDGPWKLRGLPGLILEANCEGGQYSFIAGDIRHSNNPVTNVYGRDKWEDIRRKDFWNLRRSCLDNPSRNIRSQSGTNIIVYQNVTYQNYLPTDIVDYIETDYR